MQQPVFLRENQICMKTPFGTSFPLQARRSVLVLKERMSSSRFLSVVFFAATALASFTPGLNAQKYADGGRIDAEVQNRNVRSVAIASPDANLRALAERAFALHGGFNVVPQSRAGFVFTFTPAGQNAVQLTISSGSAPFTQVVRGSSMEDALLRACDLAVAKTTGLPGFFAGKVAFVNNRSGHREIYQSDLLFRNVNQVTNDKSNSINPHLSPDGNRLMYTGYYRTGFPDLLIVDLRTNRRTTFASYQGVNTGGAFSPNGQQVAMILSSPGNAELYVSSAQGGTPKRLTHTPRSVEANPTFSPDGTQLAFVSDRTGVPQIYTMPAAGGQARRVPTNISNFCTEPVWNPRVPSQLAFTAAVAGRFQIALYDAKTGQSRWLTNAPAGAREPIWLRDGRHIIYTESRTPTAHTLYLLDTETGKRTRLVDDARFGSSGMATYAY